MKELCKLRWRSVSALSSVHQSTKHLQPDPQDFHSTPDGRERQPLLIRREFPTNPMEMGSELDLKFRKATFLAQLSWWKKHSYSLEVFSLWQHLNTLQRWTLGADISHSPTKEIQKGIEDRQVKTRWLTTYLSWKLSQFLLHYSRRAFEHHLLPQKKVKTLGNRDSRVRQQVTLIPSECGANTEGIWGEPGMLTVWGYSLSLFVLCHKAEKSIFRQLNEATIKINITKYIYLHTTNYQLKWKKMTLLFALLDS